MTELGRRSERGAVLVFTALALTALTGFLVFVIDQGVLMVARGQAQNAADAAALAGATALALDEVVDPPLPGGATEQAALGAARANPVWNEPAVAQVLFVGGGAATGCTGPSSACIRVDVYRNGQNGSNPVPTIFGSILGIASQHVRAMAIAEPAASNATECERAFALPDTGFSIPDFGSPIELRPDVANTFARGRFRLVDVWGGAEPDPRVAMRRCATTLYGIGDGIPVARFDPILDNAALVTGLNEVIALDPDPRVRWDDLTFSCLTNHSCKKYDAMGENPPADDPTATVSPRVMALPIFDPGGFGGGAITIVNHVAVFLEDVSIDPMTNEPVIHATLVPALGVIRPITAIPSFDHAFLRTIRLVR